MNEIARVPALKAIFEHCLGLKKDDEVLIICDEHFDLFLAATERAIESIGLFATIARVSHPQQERMVQRMVQRGEKFVTLPVALDAAIRVSSSILNVLGPELSTSAFRKAVLQGKRPDSRVAHVPGLSEGILAITLETPFEQVETTGEAIAWALGEAQEATVETIDRDGRIHRLHLAMGGWEDEPIISLGIITPGSWGNIPPGEVFCCPAHTSIEGSICINGSVPNFVFGPNEEIVLTFSKGKMSFDECGASGAVAFFQSEEARARGRGDEDWNTFAELGIGLNPAIRQLTGNSLFDEKVAGTLHIAVGDNSVFGHDIVAGTHVDLVTHRPTLIVDDFVVMREGDLLLTEVESRRRSPSSCAPVLDENVTIQIDERRCDVGCGRLRRKLLTGQRVGYVEIASLEVAAKLGRFYEELRPYNRVRLSTVYEDHPTFEGTPTSELVQQLNHYKMLKITPSPPH